MWPGKRYTQRTIIAAQVKLGSRNQEKDIIYTYDGVKNLKE